jgi:protocatechuate 3,4-dioxygenase, beta subunit
MHSTQRRLLLAAAAASLSTPWVSPRAQSRSVLPGMTEGPFYPSATWRQRESDWDRDLTRTQRGGQTLVARGEHLSLALTVADSRGRAIDGAEVEIWQCDVMAAYRHPNVRLEAERIDAGFQGFGAARSDGQGGVAFRTIRPVAYPGRTPHIHVRLRHASFGELTSQLFVAGEAGNARDGLWRSLSATDQAATAMRLQAAPAAAGGEPPLKWLVQHAVVVPG